MNTHPLTPQMAGLPERIQRAGRPPLHTLNVEYARRAYEAAAEALDLPRAPLARVTAAAAALRTAATETT